MQNCFLKILTETNGEETVLYKKAEVEFSDGYAKVAYEEENARVCIEVKNKCVRVERTGDYSLSLYLEEGEETTSYIGLGGAKGEIGTKTDRVDLSINETEAAVLLEYALLFGAENQNMKLRLYAQLKN